MTTPYYRAGADLTAALLNGYPLPLTRIKTTPFVVNDQASLQTDSELTIPVPASTSWALDSCLFYTATAVADVNFGLAVPAGATHLQCGNGLQLGAGSAVGTIDMTSKLNSAVGVSAGAVGTGTTLMCPFTASITISTTAGNIAIRFCQWAAEATNATLLAGSWMILTRTA